MVKLSRDTVRPSLYGSSIDKPERRLLLKQNGIVYMLCLIFLLQLFKVSSQTILGPVIYFSPNVVGQRCDLKLEIPRLGVDMLTTSQMEIDIPSGMSEAELQSTICTIDYDGLANYPLTPTPITKYGVMRLRLTTRRKINANDELRITCKTLTVPESIRTPAGYMIRIVTNGVATAEISARMVGIAPRGDDDIALKRIYAHNYLNENRRGSLSAIYSSMTTDLAPGFEFRFTYPSNAVFGSGILCSVNGIPAIYALNEDESYVKVVLSNPLYYGSLENKPYNATCAGVSFSNQYEAPRYDTQLDLLSPYGDLMSTTRTAEMREVTMILSAPSSASNGPSSADYDVRITSDSPVQMTSTGLSLGIRLTSFGLAKGDRITLIIDPIYTMRFSENTKCTMNSVAATIVSLPNLTNNAFSLNRNLTITSPLRLNDNSQRAIVYCSPVTNPVSSSQGYAYAEVMDTKNWARVAQSQRFQMPIVEMATIGDKVAKLTSYNVTVGAQTSIELSLSPIPLDVPAPTTYLFNVPPTWTLSNTVILSHTACNASYAGADPRLANVRGYATFYPDRSIIDFTASDPVPKQLTTPLRIFCDGIKMPPKAELGRADLTLLVRHNSELIMQNMAISSSEIVDSTAPVSYLSHVLYFNRTGSLRQAKIDAIEAIYSGQLGVAPGHVKTYKMEMFREEPSGALIPLFDPVQKAGGYSYSIPNPDKYDDVAIPTSSSSTSGISSNANDETPFRIFNLADHNAKDEARWAKRETARELLHSGTGVKAKPQEGLDFNIFATKEELEEAQNAAKDALKRLRITMSLRPTINYPYEKLNSTLHDLSASILREVKREIGSSESRPSLIQQMTVPANCFNGFADGGETSVDCGGPCGGCKRAEECDSNRDCLSSNCNSLYFCDEAIDADISFALGQANQVALAITVALLATAAMHYFNQNRDIPRM